MNFLPKIFCHCPVPQILVAGSSELCCLLEGEITRFYNDTSQLFPLRSSKTNSSFLPFKLCCKETSSWIRILQTYYPTQKHSTLKKQQEASVSDEHEAFFSTPLSSNPSERIRKEQNANQTKSTGWLTNMEWIQQICFETISCVVFLVDLRNLHLNLTSNAMFTTQRYTMKETAVESIQTFLEALKTFYLNRQLNSSEVPSTLPDVLVIFVFEKLEAVSSFPASREAMIKQFCQEILLQCQSTESKIVIPNATNTLSSHLLATSAKKNPSMDPTLQQQFTLQFNICMDFTTETIQPIYCQLENSVSVFCKTAVDDFKKTFKIIGSKEGFIFSEISFQLKMTFLLEFTHQCHEILSLYTHLWNKILDALSQRPPLEQWMKILYFVHIRSLIWMCQCNTVYQSSIFLKKLQGVLLQKNYNCQITRRLFLQLWNLHFSLLVSCFSNDNWIIKESCDVLLRTLQDDSLSDEMTESIFPFQNASIVVSSPNNVYKKIVSVSFFIKSLFLFEDLLKLLTCTSNDALVTNFLSTYPWIAQECMTCSTFQMNASGTAQLFKDWLFLKVSDFIYFFLPYLFYNLPLIPRSCIILIFHVARFFFMCRSYANSLVLINIISRMTLGKITTMSAFLTETSQQQVLRFLPLMNQPTIKVFHYETVSFLGYSSLVLWIHVFSILVTCRMLEDFLPLEVAPMLPPEMHLSQVDQKHMETKIFQSTRYISFCVHTWLGEQFAEAFYTDALLNVSFLVKYSILTAALTLYDSFTCIKKKPPQSLSCLNKFLFTWLTTILTKKLTKKTDSLVCSLPSMKVAPEKQALRFFLKSFTLFISANVTSHHALCSLVVYHWLSVSLIVDIVRIVTTSDNVYEFPIISLFDNSKGDLHQNNSQLFTSSLLLNAKQPYLLRVTLPNEEKQSVIWFKEIKTIEFRCVGFHQLHEDFFWIQPRICIPVLQIETLPTSLLSFSEPLHESLWASWLLYITHFHSTLSHFHSTLLDSNLLSKIQHPLQLLHSSFIDTLFASSTFHDTAPATCLFYAIIQPKTFCSSILSTASDPYDSHYSTNENFDYYNTTAHPSIIRPLSAQLTEQGNIQLNYPDTNVQCLLESVVVECSTHLFTGSPALLFCRIRYTDIVQHMTCRVHFISRFQTPFFSDSLSPDDKLTPSSYKDISTFAVYQKKQVECLDTQQTLSPYTFCVSPVHEEGAVFRLPLKKPEESNHHHFNFSSYSHIHHASSCYEPCIIFLDSPDNCSDHATQDFVIDVPFFVLPHRPGTFLLNVSLTVEFNNKVMYLVTRCVILTSQRPFHLSLQKLFASNILSCQSETSEQQTSPFSTSSHTIVPFSTQVAKIFQSSPAQYLSISIKNLCKDALVLKTMQLMVDSKNASCIYIDVNKSTLSLDASNTSAECISTTEQSVIQQGAQWSRILCIDNLLQIMETMTQLPGTSHTHADMLQTISIRVDYSYADPSLVFPTHYSHYMKNYPINSFVYTKIIGGELLSLLKEIIPCYIFTTHTQFTPLGTPFQFHATIINVTCQCMSFTLELQNVITENNEKNQKKWSSDIFFVGGLVKTSLFLSPQSSQKLSWTLIGLKEGRFTLPRICLTQILSNHPSFDHVSKHLSLTDILELELTSMKKPVESTNVILSPLILNSPISQITIMAPPR